MSGQVQRETGRTKISLRLRLNLFVTVFGFFWFGILGSFLAYSLPNIALSTLDATGIAIIAGTTLLILFGILLFNIPFHLEVKKMRNLLIERLDARLTPSDSKQRTLQPDQGDDQTVSTNSGKTSPAGP